MKNPLKKAIDKKKGLEKQARFSKMDKPSKDMYKSGMKLAKRKDEIKAKHHKSIKERIALNYPKGFPHR